jgi:predicted nucleic acid-binding protein
VADVLIDACCLINLCSSGRLPDILRGIPNQWHVCTAVATETLYVNVATSKERTRVKVDLQPWFDNAVLLPCEPGPQDELAAFVNYATRVDDGEAMSLALAKCRSWILATDDRKARRIATDDSIPIINTIQIIQEWAGRTGAALGAIKELINNISILARYRPSANVPGASWWGSNGGILSA